MRGAPCAFARPATLFVPTVVAPRCALLFSIAMASATSAALRRRVLADQLSLAADVWDVEPLPLDDPLLGRHNVVHTPHNAGRTIDANKEWAERLAVQFKPR